MALTEKTRSISAFKKNNPPNQISNESRGEQDATFFFFLQAIDLNTALETPPKCSGGRHSSPGSARIIRAV